MSHGPPKLPVQVTEVVNGRSDATARRTVRCPANDHSVPVERCDLCGWAEQGSSQRDEIDCGHPEMRMPVSQPSVADRVGVEEIMSRRVLSATPDVSIEALTSLLLDNHIGCVPIVDAKQRPIGMVTKHDLVQFHFTKDGNEEVILAHRRQRSSDDELEPGLHRFQLAATVAEDVMLPLAITLSERATVAHAAALMAIEGIHHIPVVDLQGKLIGIVSSMDVARWLARNDGYLPPEGGREP